MPWRQAPRERNRDGVTIHAPESAQSPTQPLAPGDFILTRATWNDWWKWETLFRVSFVEPDGVRRDIGWTKIGQVDQAGKSPALPAQFDMLDSSFFSLGQDESFYQEIVENVSGGTAFLRAIGDVALSSELFDRVSELEVMQESLLRNVSLASVRGQFSRILHGGARHRGFDISYTEPVMTGGDPTLRFVVEPGSAPPSNIHVLIGRNGCGKTRLLLRMADALISGKTWPNEHFVSGDALAMNELVAGLGYVSFSAFDRTTPVSELAKKANRNLGFKIFDVGLKMLDQNTGFVRLKDFTNIQDDMWEALYTCTTKSLSRWIGAVRLLESDPIFSEIDAASLAKGIAPGGLSKAAEEKFRELSSGHQVVLLTVTSLVARLEERTLVLIDEPEGHLHPPLLSAFVRALSQILSEQNSFAIIATHSPVVVQEVPANCVHLMKRTGNEIRLRRPYIETFGENVGVLTREVFGLEVEMSGFHRLIAEAIEELDSDYQAVIDRFKGELGGEAMAILGAMIAAKARGVGDVGRQDF